MYKDYLITKRINGTSTIVWDLEITPDEFWFLYNFHLCFPFPRDEDGSIPPIAIPIGDLKRGAAGHLFEFLSKYPELQSLLLKGYKPVGVSSHELDEGYAKVRLNRKTNRGTDIAYIHFYAYHPLKQT